MPTVLSLSRSALGIKICVYAISKNEEKFVKRFCGSIKDADYILIADTGSTDDTVAIAKACGAIVYNISVRPWRFDTARNIALGLIPRDMDICITLDLDEIMLSGWRSEIERVWVNGKTTLLEHKKIEENAVSPYKHTNIFSRTAGRMWRGICHENFFIDLSNKKNQILSSSDKILVKHIPDETKSRTFYYDLLKANVDEYPTKLTPLYCYMRELYIYKKYEESIKVADKFISVYKTINVIEYELKWLYKYELNDIYILKGGCNLFLNNLDECIQNYKLACKMNMKLRRPLIILAQLYFNCKQYNKSYKYYTKALSIKTQIHRREENNPQYWGCSPLLLASQIATKIDKYNEAKEYKVKALELQNKICLRRQG